LPLLVWVIHIRSRVSARIRRWRNTLVNLDSTELSLQTIAGAKFFKRRDREIRTSCLIKEVLENNPKAQIKDIEAEAGVNILTSQTIRNQFLMVIQMKRMMVSRLMQTQRCQAPIQSSDHSILVLVIDFHQMGVLSEMTNGSYRGRGGPAVFGMHQINGRGQPFAPERGGRGRGRGNPRGRGRGQYVPIPVFAPPPPQTPPNRGKQKKNQNRGRGGGLGFVVSPERSIIKNWDLSTRPLLKPIKFVRATERLFEANPDELLQAHQIPPHPGNYSLYRQFT
jgi:hypothetical protein